MKKMTFLWLMISLESTCAFAFHETYPAIIEEDIVPTPALSPTSFLHKIEPNDADHFEIPVTPKKTAAAVKIIFDEVPTDKRESIANRIQLVKLIVKKHGRAYDYRTITTKKLQDILDQLDATTTTADEPLEEAPLPAPYQE